MKKQQIVDVFRKPLAKILTRAVAYGLAALLALLGAEAAGADEPAAAIGEGLASAALLVTAAAIDRWHHRRDRAEGTGEGK